jgi:hypothetical protein
MSCANSLVTAVAAVADQPGVAAVTAVPAGGAEGVAAATAGPAVAEQFAGIAAGPAVTPAGGVAESVGAARAEQDGGIAARPAGPAGELAEPADSTGAAAAEQDAGVAAGSRDPTVGACRDLESRPSLAVGWLREHCPLRATHRGDKCGEPAQRFCQVRRVFSS